eukprot:TRINITY_DN11342_c0_g1_i1.p1 TRINITY_DN11342_c0_g1~~TRINITY_DN11342_c0_g1_i1.p1  ORF type:complete len:439 (-),score=68.52 TRINITY_DN11342_c0_g1_i1:9-1325(-)
MHNPQRYWCDSLSPLPPEPLLDGVLPEDMAAGVTDAANASSAMRFPVPKAHVRPQPPAGPRVAFGTSKQLILHYLFNQPPEPDPPNAAAVLREKRLITASLGTKAPRPRPTKAEPSPDTVPTSAYCRAPRGDNGAEETVIQPPLIVRGPYKPQPPAPFQATPVAPQGPPQYRIRVAGAAAPWTPARLAAVQLRDPAPGLVPVMQTPRRSDKALPWTPLNATLASSYDTVPLPYEVAAAIARPVEEYEQAERALLVEQERFSREVFQTAEATAKTQAYRKQQRLPDAESQWLTERDKLHAHLRDRLQSTEHWSAQQEKQEQKAVAERDRRTVELAAEWDSVLRAREERQQALRLKALTNSAPQPNAKWKAMEDFHTKQSELISQLSRNGRTWNKRLFAIELDTLIQGERDARADVTLEEKRELLDILRATPASIRPAFW